MHYHHLFLYVVLCRVLHIWPLTYLYILYPFVLFAV